MYLFVRGLGGLEWYGMASGVAGEMTSLGVPVDTDMLEGLVGGRGPLVVALVMTAVMPPTLVVVVMVFALVMIVVVSVVLLLLSHSDILSTETSKNQ